MRLVCLLDGWGGCTSFCHGGTAVIITAAHGGCLRACVHIRDSWAACHFASAARSALLNTTSQSKAQRLSDRSITASHARLLAQLLLNLVCADGAVDRQGVLVDAAGHVVHILQPTTGREATHPSGAYGGPHPILSLTD